MFSGMRVEGRVCTAHEHKHGPERWCGQRLWPV